MAIRCFVSFVHRSKIGCCCFSQKLCLISWQAERKKSFGRSALVCSHQLLMGWTLLQQTTAMVIRSDQQAIDVGRSANVSSLSCENRSCRSTRYFPTVRRDRELAGWLGILTSTLTCTL